MTVKLSNHSDGRLATQIGNSEDNTSVFLVRAVNGISAKLFMIDNDVVDVNLDITTVTGAEGGVTLFATIDEVGKLDFIINPSVIGVDVATQDFVRQYVAGSEKSIVTLRNDNLPVFGGSDVMTGDPDGIEGWYYQNADAGKLNIYPFAQADNGLKTYTTKDLKGLLFLANLKTVDTRTPYFVVYTKPTGDGNDFGWYRSRLNFEYIGGNWTASQNLVVVAGNDNPEFFANTQRVTADYIDYDAAFDGSSKGPLAEALTNDVSGSSIFELLSGDTVPTEEILYISIQTDSSESAGGYDFTLSHTQLDLGSIYEYHYESIPMATVLPDTGHQKINYSTKPQLVGFSNNQVREFDLTSGVAVLDVRSNPTDGSLYDSADDRTYCVDIVNGLIVPNQVDKQSHRVVVKMSYIQKGGATNSDMGVVGYLYEFDGTNEQPDPSEKIIMMPYGDERDGVLEFTFDVVATSTYTIGVGKGFKFKLEMLEGDGNITFDLESIQVIAI